MDHARLRRRDALFMNFGTYMIRVGEDSVTAMAECFFTGACQFTAGG
jgi:hypothetical protein